MVLTNKRSHLGIFLTLAILALTGCTQFLGGKAEVPQRRLFMINVEPLRNSLEKSARPYALQVQNKNFEVSRAYNRNEIIVRRDQYELQRDTQHHWMERPGDMFTAIIKQYLRHADLFTYVGGDRDFYERRPQYVLNGTVKALERFDSGDVWAAHLAMTMELVRQEDGQVIWQTDFDEERINGARMGVGRYVRVFKQGRKLFRCHTIESGICDPRQMEQTIRQIDFTFLQKERNEANETLEILNSSGNEQTIASAPDTTLLIETDSHDYELLPGKLAP